MKKPISFKDGKATFQGADGKPLLVNNDDRGLFLTLSAEDWTQMRHHETQRATVASVGFGICGAVIGLIAKNGLISSESFALGLILTAVAIIAGVVSYKHYERSRFHTQRADIYRLAIDCPSLRLNDLRDQADEMHERAHSTFEPIRLHILWNLFFILVAVIGLIITIKSYPLLKNPVTTPPQVNCSCQLK